MAEHLPPVVFEPTEIVALWSIQGNNDIPLIDVETSMFEADFGIGEMAVADTTRWLRLWPHQGYLMANDAALPANTESFTPLMTDISDGFLAFLVHGAQAFHFIRHYLSVDLNELPSESACLRCRLGHYPVILWWDDHKSLHLLVERSLAHSFHDYLESLLARWRPDAP